MKTLPQLAALSLAPISQGLAAPLQLDTPVKLGGQTVTLTKFDGLPYVESEYAARFRYDAASNPKLTTLRKLYHLADVVAPGKDEFDWLVHPGANRLEARTVNAFGVTGPISTAAVAVKE